MSVTIPAPSRNEILRVGVVVTYLFSQEEPPVRFRRTRTQRLAPYCARRDVIMKIARILLSGIMIASLCAIPALATDSSVEGSRYEVVEIEESPLPSPSPSAEVVDLSEVTQNQETINNNIAFLSAAVVSCAGLLVGYWTGKDILDFLW